MVKIHSVRWDNKKKKGEREQARSVVKWWKSEKVSFNTETKIRTMAAIFSMKDIFLSSQQCQFSLSAKFAKGLVGLAKSHDSERPTSAEYCTVSHTEDSTSAFCEELCNPKWKKHSQTTLEEYDPPKSLPKRQEEFDPPKSLPKRQEEFDPPKSLPKRQEERNQIRPIPTGLTIRWP